MYESSVVVVEEMKDLEIRKEEIAEVEPERNSEPKSQFAKLYKARSFLTQEERRRRYLEHIKLHRSQNVDRMRGLDEVLSEDFDAEFMMEELELSEEPMEVVAKNKKGKKKNKNKNKNRLHKKVMLSEWLLEKPSDLEENWVMKLCPIGRRCLVIAHNRRTAAYTKSGRHIRAFNSNFPGGNKSFYNSNNVFTVLDCIFNPEKECFFVLDLLAWNGISLREADVECRNFWLKSRFAETEELKLISEQNNYPFYYVESFSFNELRDQLSIPYNINGDCTIGLDGILFYIKEVPYIMRTTPLVGWLKPFMVREVLELNVHESFEAPPDYTGMKEYVAQFEERSKQLRRRRKQQTQC
ncbi:hypothetical protein ILUMI_03596 [Ignelater luminosus]|uniref:Snurportin-1 n=1 Tax=Ignelater luminosus TaxID=2038154 RepID=A0A8K0DB90_IGNLU|nr:hypothetical protein ILUMI_03596 [Ignelater luminosus]